MNEVPLPDFKHCYSKQLKLFSNIIKPLTYQFVDRKSWQNKLSLCFNQSHTNKVIIYSQTCK